MYKANITRASSGESDNTPIIDKILSLRQEKAKILGFVNFAELSMASKMADLKSAEELLEKVGLSLGPIGMTLGESKKQEPAAAVYAPEAQVALEQRLGALEAVARAERPAPARPTTARAGPGGAAKSHSNKVTKPLP